MGIRKFTLLILFIYCSTLNIQAQNCLENLFRANKLLDLGKTDDCIDLIRDCCSKNNESSVRWQAYRLMSIAHLLKGNLDSAKYSAENMLDINPTYKPNLLKDPKEFINMVSKIVVIPKFTLGLAFSAGTNSTFANITQGYVVSDYQKTYTAKSGIQFGTNLGFYINPKLVLELGILATSKKFTIDYSFPNWNVKVNERLTYLDIPLTAKYIFRPQKKLRPFVQLGGFAGYLLYAQNDFISNYTPLNQTYTLNKLNIVDRRNRLNLGLIGGLGIYYKLNQGHWSVMANYYQAFSPINKAEKRYDYIEQIYTYYYVDDDIILNNLAINLGYTFYLNYKVYRNKK